MRSVFASAVKPHSPVCVAVGSVIAVLIAGCTTESPYALSDGYFCAGDYGSAARCITSEAETGASSENVLDNLYVGSANFSARSYGEAVRNFSAAESGLKEQDLQCAAGRGVGLVGDVLSAGSGDYLATTYDEAMMNLYQSLSYLAQGNIDRARVEFNRVDVRLGRAADRNSAMIRRQQEKIASAKRSGRNAAAQAATKGATCEGVTELENALSAWNAYADYMNPAAVFMCGAFRLLWGDDGSDIQKGKAYFKRAFGIHPNQVARRAIEILSRYESGAAARNDREYVLVLFEDGMGPQKVEERREVIIPYRYPIHAGVALPMLQHRPQAHASLSVFDGDACTGHTETICEFDRVVAAEFKEEFKWIAARAILGACLRVGVQIASMETLRKQLDDQVSKGKLSPFARDLSLMAAGSALSAASAATTRADTRIWSTLPRDYQAAILPKPASGRLSIRDATGTRTLVDVEIPQDERPYFVYVKIPTTSSAAVAFAVPGNK